MIFIAPYSVVQSQSLAVHFHPEHLADLRASGLSDETIKAASVYSLAPNAIQEFFSSSRTASVEIQSALCFPYQRGRFARIKLFPALGKMKYAQPPKTRARLYFPFPITACPLYLCEGEKKALAGHQAGLNAAGIGGVWSWLRHGEPIDDLKSIEWDGREVVIVPDSDVFKRQDLMRAIYALGRELQDLGAYVELAQIPQSGEKKTGLDDFIITGGKIEAMEIYRLSESSFQKFGRVVCTMEDRKGIEGVSVMTLTYCELVDLCSLGERLHYWRQAFPGKPDGTLGAHVLTETWRFIPASEISNPELTYLVESILNKRKTASPQSGDPSQPANEARFKKMAGSLP